jgi:large subunit ribosomal protein L23
VITLNKDPRDILLAPVVSEKSYGLLDEGKYTFIVDPRANKTEIKIRRTKFGLGKRKNTKRAIVTLKEGSIDIFGGSPV